jgi:small multidrug resistance pump
MPYIYLFAAIVAEVTGTTFLKASEGFSRPWPSLVTLACFGVAFYLLSLTLRDIPTGIAYAIWSGVGIVLIAIASWLFHGQKLDALALLGMALIVSGVVVMNLFSNMTPH